MTQLAENIAVREDATRAPSHEEFQLSNTWKSPPGIFGFLISTNHKEIAARYMHSGLLGALITLARTSWYPAYDDTSAWHLSPLEDQQLGGLIMWIPAGTIYVAAALLFIVGWMREADRRVRVWEQSTAYS